MFMACNERPGELGGSLSVMCRLRLPLVYTLLIWL